MARIAGVNLKLDKPVFVALTGIYGIGFISARAICRALSIDPMRRASGLDATDWSSIRDYIDAGFVVEGELRRKISLDIKRLRDIGCYRGIRHRKNLPVRGQRTRSNARTCSGGRGRAIAAKKR
jgi:small subunit ribosomal protein S13